MNKSNIVLKYVDYIIKNAPIGEDFYINIVYERAAEDFNASETDIKLKPHLFNVRKVLETQGFVFINEDENLEFTDIGIKAQNQGGYFNFINSKNKLSKFQILTLILSLVAILSTLGQFLWTNNKSSTLETYTERVDSLYHSNKLLNSKYDSMIHQHEILKNQFLPSVYDTLENFKILNLPNK